MEHLIHFFVTSSLTGLIWVIQVVHYPTFHWIKEDDYISYAVFHTNRITYVVAPLMIAELFLALRLFFMKDLAMHWILLLVGLTLLVWASTFFLQVPLHGVLAIKKDGAAIERLIHTNWIRTMTWSLKATVLGYILWNSFRDKIELL